MMVANCQRRRAWAGNSRALAVCAVLLFFCTTRFALAAPPAGPRPQAPGRDQTATARKPVAVHTARRAPLPSDDWTYRPTVVVRRGSSQGSGTIIASVDGETLVLTAAHVLEGDGPVCVELHRYNLGLERGEARGEWPRVIQAATAARDLTADVAIIRIEKMTALPYVARLARADENPLPNSIVSSIGIDLGRKLSLWSSRLVETTSIELNESGKPRPFLITEKIPEHGRSGGGLFMSSGALVGVCIGHAGLGKARRSGVFAASESVRHMLEENELSETVGRSDERMARLTRDRYPSATRPAETEPPGSIVTTSRSKGEKAPSVDAP